MSITKIFNFKCIFIGALILNAGSVFADTRCASGTKSSVNTFCSGERLYSCVWRRGKLYPQFQRDCQKKNLDCIQWDEVNFGRQVTYAECSNMDTDSSR